MAASVVGAAVPVKIARTAQRPTVQNLGPGDVYIDKKSNVTTGTGLKIPVDQAYEWPADLTADLYAISSLDNTDVRVVLVG